MHFRFINLLRPRKCKFFEMMCPGFISMTINVNLTYFANGLYSPQAITGSNPVGSDWNQRLHFSFNFSHWSLNYNVLKDELLQQIIIVFNTIWLKTMSTWKKVSKCQLYKKIPKEIRTCDLRVAAPTP